MSPSAGPKLVATRRLIGFETVALLSASRASGLVWLGAVRTPTALEKSSVASVIQQEQTSAADSAALGA